MHEGNSMGLLSLLALMQNLTGVPREDEKICVSDWSESCNCL